MKQKSKPALFLFVYGKTTSRLVHHNCHSPDDPTTGVDALYEGGMIPDPVGMLIKPAEEAPPAFNLNDMCVRMGTFPLMTGSNWTQPNNDDNDPLPVDSVCRIRR